MAQLGAEDHLNVIEIGLAGYRPKKSDGPARGGKSLEMCVKALLGAVV